MISIHWGLHTNICRQIEFKINISLKLHIKYSYFLTVSLKLENTYRQIILAMNDTQELHSVYTMSAQLPVICTEYKSKGISYSIRNVFITFF